MVMIPGTFPSLNSCIVLCPISFSFLNLYDEYPAFDKASKKSNLHFNIKFTSHLIVARKIFFVNTIFSVDNTHKIVYTIVRAKERRCKEQKTPVLNLENRTKQKAEALKLTEGGRKRGKENRPQPIRDLPVSESSKLAK